ncbi:MAG: nicotinate-nucleotide--dimethylbenzimidazole phosphoribosyltransferase [Reichenbachiella sp.]
MKKFNISALDTSILKEIQHKINFKTKPLEALGDLETITKKICVTQQSLDPELVKPSIVVFAGDHGLAQAGVSAYPPEVTHQMVLNFLNGGAAINVFCKQNNIDLQIIDAGVNFDFDHNSKLTNKKINHSTKNSLTSEAMTSLEFDQAIEAGVQIVDEKFSKGCNIIGFGEMGIGNTSAASLIMSCLMNLDISDCVGKGTGLDAEGLKNKQEVLASVVHFHKEKLNQPLEFFRSVAGFEMAMMLGAYLQAAENKMTIIVDGFITSAVFLMAQHLYTNIGDYAIFSHQSNEQGHQKILSHLKALPILKLDMRLGEGTGCALAYPLIKSSIAFMNEMASFESAEVSHKS